MDELTRQWQATMLRHAMSQTALLADMNRVVGSNITSGSENFMMAETRKVLTTLDKAGRTPQPKEKP